jgi:hypothetical protein
VKAFLLGAGVTALLGFATLYLLGARYKPQVAEGAQCIQRPDLERLGATVTAATCGRLPLVAIEKCAAPISQGVPIVCKEVEGMRCLCGATTDGGTP